MNERKGLIMGTDPTVENVIARFDARTVAHRLDVVDTGTAEGSTVRVYNAAGFEIMTLKSDRVSTRFDSLFGGRPVGVRHAEDGRLYAVRCTERRRRHTRGACRRLPVRRCSGGPELRVRAPHLGGGGVRSGDCDGEPNSAVRRARDGDSALLRERSRLPALSTTTTTTTRSPALCAGLRRERREST